MSDFYLDARDAARLYRGKLPFMLKMKRAAIADPAFIPSYRQAEIITRCTSRDGLKWGRKRRAC